MNLAEIALRQGETDGNGTAFLTPDGPVDRAAFQRMVFTFADQIEALGLKPADKVLFRMSNSVEFAAAFLAVVWTGGIPVLQNSQFGRNELEHIVGVSSPALFLISEKLRHDSTLDDLRRGALQAIVTRDGLENRDGTRIATGAPARRRPFDADRDAAAFVVFTSGTTGKPKGIVHAHRWLEALGDSNRARIPTQRDDVVLATGEWSFISALGHNVLFPLRNGVTGSIMEDRAAPDRILQTIERDGVTLLYSVATLYRRILSVPDIERRYDLRSLRAVNSTGEPLENSVRDEWQQRFGCPIWEHYGISEAQMVIGDGPSTAKREGSAGRAWGVRVAVLDEASTPLQTGSIGTLAFGAEYPGFFLGYLKDEALTRSTVRGGWFVTSDLARMDDDGYVYIVGRADDCFKSKGVLIAPRELEDAILGLGRFEEACVFAVPDSEIGNKIGAAVVPRAGAAPWTNDETDLAKLLSGRIAPFKLPHVVMVLDQLPKNANGKTQRSQVARMARPAASTDGR